jgi:hypothetical protein
MNLHAPTPARSGQPRTGASRRRRVVLGATLAVLAGSLGMVGAPGRADAAAASGPVFGCPYQNLCVYRDKDFKVQIGPPLFDCGFIDLRGKSGYNNISSYVNNQTPGTVSTFYDIVNGAWKAVLSERALGYRANLALDKGTDGKVMNDRIKGIRVC